MYRVNSGKLDLEEVAETGTESQGAQSERSNSPAFPDRMTESPDRTGPSHHHPAEDDFRKRARRNLDLDALLRNYITKHVGIEIGRAHV